MYPSFPTKSYLANSYLFIVLVTSIKKIWTYFVNKAQRVFIWSVFRQTMPMYVKSFNDIQASASHGLFSIKNKKNEVEEDCLQIWQIFIGLLKLKKHLCRIFLKASKIGLVFWIDLKLICHLFSVEQNLSKILDQSRWQFLVTIWRDIELRSFLSLKIASTQVKKNGHSIW